MGVQEFYRQFITEEILQELSKTRKRAYQSIDEFVVYRYREITNPYHISWVAEQLSTEELKLIDKLKSSKAKNGYYTIDLSDGEYPFLIDQYLVVPFNERKGAVHEETLRSLIEELNKNDKDLKWLEELSPLKKTILMSYSEMRLEELLMGITITQLKEISKALSHSPASLQKAIYVNDLKRLLTDKEKIREILLSLSDEAFQVIRKHAENDYPFYNNIKEYQELISFGLIIVMENDYGISHPEVLKAIRSTNLKKVKSQRYKNNILRNKESQLSYNAYRIRISLVGGSDIIFREMIIPTRLNFYEMHLIIQIAFGWSKKFYAEFLNDNYVIRVYSEDTTGETKKKPVLLSSYTQVDAFLSELGTVSYIYNYKAKWHHKVELVEFISKDEDVYPEIVDYGGPSPIEQSEGIEDFDRLHMILQDKNNPEYKKTAEFARLSNYKIRYPKSAINRKLKRIFSKQYALTEFNDEDSKSGDK